MSLPTKRTLYDLVWAFPLPEVRKGVPVALTSQNTLQQPWPGVTGAILFPALMTPAVIVGDKQPLDLLIAFRKSDVESLKEEEFKLLINLHLKVMPELDPKRLVAVAPLFVGEGDKTFLDFIRYKGPFPLDATKALETDQNRFRGVLHPAAAKLYTDAGFDVVYWVNVDATCLEPAAHAKPRVSLSVLAGEPGSAKGHEEADVPADDKEAVIVPQHASAPLQDRVVHVAARVQNFPKQKGKGAYGFKVADLGGAKDAIAGTMNFQLPVQAHHPVVFFAGDDAKDYLNLGHMSDIHMSARQQVLAKSPAQIVAQPSHRTIGEMVNICSQNTASLFDGLGGDPEVDLVVVGGDVVDFINNVLLDDPAQTFAKPMDVWDVVKVTAANAGKYRDNVDFLAFYSLLIAAYNEHEKPVFAITGNHDAYYEPYGITPRVSMKQAADLVKDMAPTQSGKVDATVNAAVRVQETKKATYDKSSVLPGKEHLKEDAQNVETDPAKIVVKRANEGIPADHNLTFYEAILAFGDSYSAVLTMANKAPRPPSSFWAEKMGWFHHVLTPFSDFSLQLPKQDLVALGWGANEHMSVDVAKDGNFEIAKDTTGKGQGIGHLPRASECISPLQLDLVKVAAAKDRARKLLLTTHFTFVSYNNQLKLTDALSGEWGRGYFGKDALGGWEEGDIYYNDPGSGGSTRTFSQSDMGTFHHNRKALYKDLMVTQRRIQVVLTGHSHRRGLYTIRRDSTFGNSSVKTGFFDSPTFAGGVPQSMEVDVSLVKDPGPGSTGRKFLVRAEDQQYPWIVLSDSGGSIPRMNVAGEFQGSENGGQGSDRPGGTRILFDAKGEVERLEPVRVPLPRAHPRLAVALDYLDIMGGLDVIESIQTDAFWEKDEMTPTFAPTFELKFHKSILEPKRYGLSILGVELHTGFAGSSSTLTFTGSGTTWSTPAGLGTTLRHLSKETRGKLILALRCDVAKPRAGVYDTNDPWTFEVRFQRNRAKSRGLFGFYYEIERIKDYAEVPRLVDWKRFYASR